MLTIDRVEAQMDLLPHDEAAAPRAQPASLANDPLAREQFRAAVVEVLREELRALERSGR